MTLHSIKGTLARLLATENLTVEHKQCDTASFDVDSRVLSLPLWVVSNTVYDLLLGHEVGHALFTPKEDWDAIAGTIPKSYINIVEDARIEKMMKRKFAGLRKDFYNGYRELNDQDFFGVADRDINSLKLIDRINLHFKIGIVNATAPIEFTPEEQVLVDRVEQAESFADALSVARDIYDYQQSADTSTQQETDNQGNGTGTDSSFTDQESPEENIPRETEGDSDQDAPVGDAEGPVEGFEQDDFDFGGQDAGITDKNFSDALKHHQERNSYNSPSYFDVPIVNTKSVVVPWTTVWDKAEAFWGLPQYTDPSHEAYVGISFDAVDGDYNSFRKSVATEVNYLVKEFECKKSAAAYARASTSRTGVLDTQKLHNYKLTDDIFKRVTITPDGKNHGLVFLLDWSGSMGNVIFDTVKQVLTLSLFCKKVNIPFSVYAFGNFFWDVESADDHHIHHKNPKAGQFDIPPNFKLAEFLSGDCNKNQFERQCRNLFRIASYFESKSYFRYMLPIPQDFQLGGTPLNEGLLCLRTIIGEFKQKFDLQKVHSVILTDGESCCVGQLRHSKYAKDGVADKTLYRCAGGANPTIRDKSIGYVGQPVGNTAYELTPALLEYLQYVYPAVNFIGIRLASSRDAANHIRYRCDLTVTEAINKIAEFRKRKSVTLKAQGYTELFLMQAESMSANSEFEVAEDATNAQIRSAFRKSLKGKANNKKILSSFISHIA